MSGFNNLINPNQDEYFTSYEDLQVGLNKIKFQILQKVRLKKKCDLKISICQNCLQSCCCFAFYFEK